MASDTYVFGNNLINQFRVSYNRIGANPQVTSGLTNSEFGINVPNNDPLRARGRHRITGLFGAAHRRHRRLGDPQQPFVDRLNESFQFANDVTWVRGQHSVKLGLDVRRSTCSSPSSTGPTATSRSAAHYTGNAAADFLLGLPAQFRRTTANASQDGSGWSYAGYIQDEFRSRRTSR